MYNRSNNTALARAISQLDPRRDRVPPQGVSPPTTIGSHSAFRLPTEVSPLKPPISVVFQPAQGMEFARVVQVIYSGFQAQDKRGVLFDPKSKSEKLVVRNF